MNHPIDVTVTPGSGGPGYPPIEKNSSLMQGLTVNPGQTRSLLFPYNNTPKQGYFFLQWGDGIEVPHSWLHRQRCRILSTMMDHNRTFYARMLVCLVLIGSSQTLSFGESATLSVESKFDTEWEQIYNETNRGVATADPWQREETLKNLVHLLNQNTIEDLDAEKQRKTIEVLLRLAGDSDPFIQALSWEGLWHWHSDQRIKAAARESWRDPLWLVRSAVIRLIVGTERDILRAAFEDEDPNIRLHAVGIFWELPADDEMFQHLLERLSDPYSVVPFETLRTFRIIRDFRVIPYLLWLHGQGGVLQKEVERTIKELSGMSVEEARDQLSLQPLPLPFELGKAPVRRPPIQNPSSCLSLMNAADRVTCILQLTWVEASEGLWIILRALDDSNARVRYAATQAIYPHLGKIIRCGPMESALASHAFDLHHKVREQVQELIRLAHISRVSYEKAGLSLEPEGQGCL